MVHLGQCYQDGGSGLERNLELALYWFQKGEDHGCTYVEDQIREVQEMLQTLNSEIQKKSKRAKLEK